jgi:hypothetical protein
VGRSKERKANGGRNIGAQAVFTQNYGASKMSPLEGFKGDYSNNQFSL